MVKLCWGICQILVLFDGVEWRTLLLEEQFNLGNLRIFYTKYKKMNTLKLIFSKSPEESPQVKGVLVL